MGFLPYLLVAYALTLPVDLIADLAKPSSDLIAGLKLACLGAFAWHAAALIARGQPHARSAAALALATGLLWFALMLMHAFRVATMLPFTFAAVIASIDDSRRTVVQALGERGAALGLAVLALLAAASIVLAWSALREARKRLLGIAPGRPVVLACAAGLAYLVAADARYAADELLLYPQARLGAYPFSSPDYSALPVRAGESVFILQLESVNSPALFKRTPEGRDVTWSIAQPGLRAVLDEGKGVLLPFFWANSMQTHRAQESILCAVSGNVGQALSLDPVRLQRRTCLPRHLAGAGYDTVFFYSYFDLEFFNFAAFHRRAGFARIVYGQELMAPDDRRHAWGYDDCAFYRRAFDYLERGGLGRRERVFAYFEVGMNHSPFFGTDKYPGAHPFPRPATPTEHYLNSVAEQDHCLLEFWRRFRGLGRDDVHLFIVPDHSVPVGAQQADAAFLTWLAYVPPRARRAEFRPGTVLEPRFSQAQIYPTVLELLGAGATPQSFAFALQGRPRTPGYESCHVLTDPFHTSLIIVRDDERAELRIVSGEVSATGKPREKLGYWKFRERYYCR